jgi:hypothetical protein
MIYLKRSRLVSPNEDEEQVLVIHDTEIHDINTVIYYGYDEYSVTDIPPVILDKEWEEFTVRVGGYYLYIDDDFPSMVDELKREGVAYRLNRL